MRRFLLASAIGAVMLASAGFSVHQAGPYAVLKKTKVGGVGGFDYVYADTANRRLYIPRSGAGARVTVFNLDTFDSVGVLTGVSARGAAVDPKSNHGFASSKPVAMWDARTLQPIKTIDVQGNPDGIMYDRFNARIWVFSHAAPHATIIDAAAGTVVGTLDLGGAPEQAVSDGAGHVYVDIEDKDSIAVIDAKSLTVTAKWTLGGKGGTPAGLAFDVKNHVLFVACRTPATFVIMSSDDGHIITSLPIGAGTDGAVFNPATMEVFSSNGGDSSLTVVKETSPTSFAVIQNVRTTRGAKTLTLDFKTNRVVLIAQEFAVPTAPATPPPPGGRGGRGPAALPESFTIWVVGKP